MESLCLNIRQLTVEMVGVLISRSKNKGGNSLLSVQLKTASSISMTAYEGTEVINEWAGTMCDNIVWYLTGVVWEKAGTSFWYRRMTLWNTATTLCRCPCLWDCPSCPATYPTNTNSFLLIKIIHKEETFILLWNSRSTWFNAYSFLPPTGPGKSQV